MPRWTEPGHALARHRRGLRGWPAMLAWAVLFAGAALLATHLDPLPPRFTGEVSHVADGDSFRIGGDRIRLVGLDAPELDQTCWRDDGSEWACGRAARELMSELTARGRVACAPEGTDRFGRTLARCSAGEADLGAAMVEAGLAIDGGGYAREQSAARAAKRGLWSGRFIDPRTWRDEGPGTDPGPGLVETVWNWLRELTGARSLR
jgi:endonuclease YncB( thermonuclease family)